MHDKQSTALISIYDAANDSQGWGNSLDACVDYVRAHSANIMFQENDINSRWRYSLGSEFWRNCSPENMATSIAMFEKYDTAAWKFVHKHKKQTLLADTDFWKDLSEIDEREDYKFFRNQMGFLRKVGCTLNDNLCWTDNIAFQFPAHMKVVPIESMQRMQSLLPHAAKSIELWRTFSILKSQYKAVLSALDHVRVGLCIAEPGGRIIVSNDEANRIFDLGSSIRLGKDRLIHCKSSVARNSIQQSIEKSCATSSGQASSAETFQVIGENPDKQIAVEVAPLRDSGAEISSHFNGALLTLIDFSSDLDIDCARVAKAYKLTSKEAEVCQLLVKGTSVVDIADIRNVKPETIKTQLKSIYRKTGAGGRIKLTRLALKSSPPVN